MPYSECTREREQLVLRGMNLLKWTSTNKHFLLRYACVNGRLFLFLCWNSIDFVKREKLGRGLFVYGYVAVTGLNVVTLILMSNVVYDCYEVAASFILHPLITIDLLVGFFQQEKEP